MGEKPAFYGMEGLIRGASDARGRKMVDKCEAGRALAVACGLHKRLGAGSPLQALSGELMELVLEEELLHSVLPTLRVGWSACVPWHGPDGPEERVYTNVERHGASTQGFRIITDQHCCISGALPLATQQHGGTLHYFGERRGVHRRAVSFTVDAAGIITVVFRELHERMSHILLHAEVLEGVAVIWWAGWRLELMRLREAPIRPAT